jgi:hypothetical protein
VNDVIECDSSDDSSLHAVTRPVGGKSIAVLNWFCFQ